MKCEKCGSAKVGFDAERSNPWCCLVCWHTFGPWICSRVLREYLAAANGSLPAAERALERDLKASKLAGGPTRALAAAQRELRGLVFEPAGPSVRATSGAPLFEVGH